MKNKVRFRQGNFVQTVTSYDEKAVAEDGLFDDCPLCQDLRRRIESGEATPWEEEEEEEEEQMWWANPRGFHTSREI